MTLNAMSKDAAGVPEEVPWRAEVVVFSKLQLNYHTAGLPGPECLNYQNYTPVVPH